LDNFSMISSGSESSARATSRTKVSKGMAESSLFWGATVRGHGWFRREVG
jgi:hypothetical protein